MYGESSVCGEIFVGQTQFERWIMGVAKYKNQIYAGVLGKILGVYLGRPVEGWSYEKIRETFDEIKYYVHEEAGVPLIVVDDDISGTFGFFRAIEDNGYDRSLPAEAFGDTWLNYMIEKKTIIWWGGPGRSTEHTAYLNLKNGISAPMSGSMELNGKTLAEQIGAQIFIDAIVMACPNNPDLAVELVRKAAGVSHDGIAVEAACHWAALEAMAFEEKNLDILLDRAIAYVKDRQLIEMIADVRDICSREKDWRRVREYLDAHYGYDLYPGCCHMVPNHALMIASVILGGDDFQKSISIAVSAGWDTDCNAGNIGAFNGIRLGIEGINAGADFRTPVADFMYVVTADGGSTVTDAVKESRRIIETAAKMKGEAVELPKEKYAFEFPGSLQGFQPDEISHGASADVRLSNYNEISGENGLLIQCIHAADGVPVRITTPTFCDFTKMVRNYEAVASPTLYSSQVVKTKAKLLEEGEVSIRPYILYYDNEDKTAVLYGEFIRLDKKGTTFEWKVPDTKGMLIFKLGYEISSRKRFDGSVVISSIDWTGAPEEFAQRELLMNSGWRPNPLWLSGFASSAVDFAAEYKHTYFISHTENDGLATIGTRDWENYSVEVSISFCTHKSVGVVIRSKGHKRYYGAVLENFDRAVLYAQKDRERMILGTVPFKYEENKVYNLKLTAKGKRLVFAVNGKQIIEAEDSLYSSGAAGFIVSKGSVCGDSLVIKRV